MSDKPTRRAAGNLRPARLNKVRSYVKADQPETLDFKPDDTVVAIPKVGYRPSNHGTSSQEVQESPSED